MKNDNLLQIKSFAFAVNIVKLYQVLAEELLQTIGSIQKTLRSKNS